MEETRDKGKRWVISTRDEMRQAVIEVAREAKRKVSIFTHDLEPGIYDDPDFLEVIKRLVLDHDVLGIPGTAFTPSDEGWVRFSYANLDVDDFDELALRLNEMGG